MDCTQCKEALSARLDGEESAAQGCTIDAHLATCAACRRFADEAARVTRLARTAVATQDPDVVETVLAAAPRSRRPRLATALRVMLGLVGLAQLDVAVVGVLTAQSGGHGSQGIVLEGASVAHFAHESAAWNLALGVGFLWIAWRSPRTSGMVPTL
ncbi:MAG TPA: zf-HC2 domain-containing protein, partial [Pseudonocardiaceae bacterium]|nr:zf-HC2 domain-containing protein [Pseudonocardiaceae bacterium]